MFIAQILLNSLVIATQVIMVAACMYLIQLVARFFQIFLSEMLVAGAYGYLIVTVWGHQHWILGVIAGMLFAIVLNLFSLFLMRNMIRKNQNLLALLMSITLGIIFQSIFALGFGVDGKFLSEGVLQTFEIFGLRLSFVGLITIIVGVMTAIAAYICIYILPYGRMIRAISQHRESSQVMGIKEKKVLITVFIITAMVMAVVGILVGLNNPTTPYSGFLPTITAFIALLMGGVRDFKGTVVAALILTIIPEVLISVSFGDFSLNESWIMVLVFLIALVAMVIRPQGLFSNITRKA